MPDLRPHPLALLFPLLLWSCAAAAPARFPGPKPVLPAASRSLPMFDGQDGRAVSWDELLQRALAADVVLIGELHHHPLGMGASAALFEDLLAARPEGPALALEFLERDRQRLLDDFADGLIDEQQLVKLARLSESNYPWGHRAMVLAAVAAGRPVWAANAPRRYVTVARKQGLQRLRSLDSERAALVTLPEQLLEGDYQRRFWRTMHGAELGDEVVSKFFRSQNVWDATMADTVLAARQAGANPVVLVVGRFHIGHDGGTLQRIRAAAPQLSILTLAIAQTDAKRLAANDIELADVVLYAGPFEDEE